MRTTGHPQTEEARVAIAFYLAVCMFVCGLFAFGFYNLFQPRRFPNPGLTAYNPPPATVITYAATAKFAYGEPAPSETATEEPSYGAPDEATRAYASATPSVTAPTPVVFAPAPHVSREKHRPAGTSRRERVKLIRRERSGPPRPGLIPSHAAASPLFIPDTQPSVESPLRADTRGLPQPCRCVAVRGGDCWMGRLS
jgi:hypothetical protein